MPATCRSRPRPALRPLRPRCGAGVCVSRAEEGGLQVQRDELLRRRERRHLRCDRPALGQHERRGVDSVLGQRDWDRDGRRRGLHVLRRHPELCRGRDEEDLRGHDRRQRHRERPEQDDRLQACQCDPGGSQIKTTTAKLTIIDNEGPGTLDFSSSSYTVLEGAGVASVTVNRIGATNLKLSVDYATQAAPTNPATAGTDYTPISPAKTLTFNVGEAVEDLPGRRSRRLERRGSRERGSRALQPEEPDRRRRAADRPERTGRADDQRRRRVDVQVQRARVLRR